MVQIIFGVLTGFSLLYALIRGDGAACVLAMLEGADNAVQAALSMAGGFAFFCGLICILKKAGAVGFLSRRFSPLLKRLLGPTLPDNALDYVSMNLAANMLGLGNAATPMGIEAAKRMARGESATNALCLFLVINASSVQLLPSTVISLRAAAGSAAPGAIVLPTLITTLLSTLAGILSCKLWEKKS